MLEGTEDEQYEQMYLGRTRCLKAETTGDCSFSHDWIGRFAYMKSDEIRFHEELRSRTRRLTNSEEPVDRLNVQHNHRSPFDAPDDCPACKLAEEEAGK